jgi:enoyl-CoA hydratase/carnithine racemase
MRKMMPEKFVLSEVSNHIAAITLNRPQQNNVINPQLSQEMQEICRRINQDNDIYVVTITGNGNMFCGGSEPGVDIEIARKFQIAEAVAGLEKPVIAAVNGDALGEGLEIALACDVRVAAQNARFGLSEIVAGLIPSDGGTQRLPRIIGRGKALEMILTGETINTAEALEYGLITKAVPAGILMTEIGTLAKSIADKAPVALRYIKEAINKGLDMTMEQGLRLEADLYFLLHTTGDRTEGIRAFQQKKPPEFKGQ